MDFGALPPEVNSARMYAGPGPGSMLAASAQWESLAAELQAAASGYQSAITTLTQDWQGPTSTSMAAAIAPYLTWMTATAEQCQQSATQAAAATAAYEAAYAMTLPPPLIAANRAQLMALIATNLLGQNTPAIMATEAAYSEMWAQDAAAMYNYAASSASASTFSTFTSPPQTTNPGGIAGQAGTVAHTAATHAASHAHTALSSVPQTLQGMANPGSGAEASGMAMGEGASVASAAYSPLSSLASLTNAPTKGASNAVKSAASGTSAASALSGLAGVLSSPQGVILGTSLGVFGDVGGAASDVGGVGFDLYGLDLDYTGLALDMEGAGSILGAEGVGGFPGGLGNLGDLGGLGGLGEGAAASVGQAPSLGTLSVPPGWAHAASSVTPLPTALDANAGAATASPATTTGVSRLPLGGMVGREADHAAERVGFRPSVIPRSPVAG